MLFLVLQFILSSLSIPTEALENVATLVKESSMAEWVDDSSGVALRLKYPKGCVGTSRKNGCAL